MFKKAKTESKKFKASDLSVLAYANNFTLWHYVSEIDDNETVFSPHYFDDAADMMRKGDLIIVNTTDMNTNAWVVGNDANGVRIS